MNRPSEPLLDFAILGRHLRVAAWCVGGLTGVGMLVEVARGGSVWAAALRWATTAVAGALLVTAVLVALQAYRAADAAQRRGDRLSGDDVRRAPPRRPPEP
ncbi:MAG: hypothetical protein WD080_11510 [Egibacteraceae bacterium]